MNYVSEALEQQHVSLKYLIGCYTDPSQRPGVTPKERAQWITDIHSLDLAVPFFWNKRTTELVTSVMHEFNLEDIKCTRNIVVEDVGWMWFADQAPFEIESYRSKRMLPVKAIAWYWFGNNGQPYLGMTAYAQTTINGYTGLFTGPVGPVLWACVHENDMMSEQIPTERLNFQGYTDDRTEIEAFMLRQFTVAANTFMRQELLRRESVPCERHTRKRLMQGKAKKLPDIQVIHLRKLAQKKKSESNGDSAPREYDWQWWVGGHVRQQWYPSLQEHLPIVISPYLKGPEDKPIKPRTTPIYSVTR